MNEIEFDTPLAKKENKEQAFQKSKPKLGFIGVGWIGRNRLEAIVKNDVAEVKAISDANPEFAAETQKLAPSSSISTSLDTLIAEDLDGIIIATPSALHATQSLQAIRQGKAVFCQKPLGRNKAETLEVVEAAKKHDVLLGVDFSYRHTQGIRKLKEVIDSGELGDIYGVNLVFHNAYGPDKSWYFDPALAGGGCVMDLGVHLIDLALWLFKNPSVAEVHSQLFSKGKVITSLDQEVEDYAIAQFMLNDKTAVQLSCSWNLPAGCDAVIEASFYGSKGGVSFKNIDGSFYDFKTERFHGTSREQISSPPDDWGGKAAVAWAEALAKGNKFDEEAYDFVATASVIDEIYKK